MKITRGMSKIPSFTGITNLYHLFYMHNIKECLVDKECKEYVSGCFAKIGTIQVDFNITEPIKPDYISAKKLKDRETVAGILLESPLKQKYDVFIVHDRNFEKMIPLMHRSLFIFVLDGKRSEEFIPYTFVNDCFDGVLYANDFHSMMFPSVRLTVMEQTYVRDKPFRFLKKEVQLVKLLNKEKRKPVVVEIGSCRNALKHDLDVIDPICCNDSHSTFFWAREKFSVHTVDVNPMCEMVIHNSHKDGSLKIKGGLKTYNEDGIKFLENYNVESEGTIDFLFLDAWDVVPGTDYAEKHLEAYEKAESKLSKKCLLAIDDTDIAMGGKGRKLIPVLLQKGWVPLYKGRHTVFYKGPLHELFQENVV